MVSIKTGSPDIHTLNIPINMIKTAYKKFTNGSHRARPPEQTLALMQKHMASMGITRIANVTGLDQIGIPVVTVCRPDSRAVSVAQGKGLDLAAAKVSGLMEAIETWHAEHPDLPLRLASYREMKARHAVVDVDRLAKLTVSRFHQDLPILWVEGRDYSTRQGIYVPYEMVHCNYSLPLPSGSGSFMMSTNGLASGNHPLEAISHGLCELIERDATSLWQMAHRADALAPSIRGDATRLNLATVDDPHCREILALYRQAGVAVGVWDTTSDLAIPSFYCTIINEKINASNPLYPASGAGTHPCKSIALLRALTEAAQTRLTMISGSRDDVSLDEYRHGQNNDFHQRIQARLKQNSRQQGKNYQLIPDWQHETFEQDMALLSKQLAGQGLEQIIVVDLTRAALDIPVVRVIVPGLEGIQDVPGYQPGQRAQRLLSSVPRPSPAQENRL